MLKRTKPQRCSELPRVLLARVFEFCSWKELVLITDRVSREWKQTPKILVAWPCLKPQEFSAAVRRLSPARVQSLALDCDLPRINHATATAISFRLANDLSKCTKLTELTLKRLVDQQAQQLLDAITSPDLQTLAYEVCWNLPLTWTNPRLTVLRELSLRHVTFVPQMLAPLVSLRSLKTFYCGIPPGCLPLHLTSYESIQDGLAVDEIARIADSLESLHVINTSPCLRGWTTTDLTIVCRHGPRLRTLDLTSYRLPNNLTGLQTLADDLTSEFRQLLCLRLVYFEPGRMLEVTKRVSVYDT